MRNVGSECVLNEKDGWEVAEDSQCIYGKEVGGAFRDTGAGLKPGVEGAC